MLNYIQLGLSKLLKNKASICSAGACVGLVTSVVLAADAGEKASEYDEWGEKAKCYIPTIISTAVTGGLIIASDRIHMKNELALAAVASMYKDKYDKLSEKVREKIGEEEHGQLQKDLAEDKKLESEKPKELPSGCILVYLMCSDEYIVTTKEKLAWGLLKVNEKMCCDGRCCLDVFVKCLGGSVTQIDEGLWWDIDIKEQFNEWQHLGMEIPFVKLRTDFHLEDRYNADVLYFNVEPSHRRYEDMVYYA